MKTFFSLLHWVFLAYLLVCAFGAKGAEQNTFIVMAFLLIIYDEVHEILEHLRALRKEIAK